MTIGLFDSGSGGLTILDAVRHSLPSHDLIYLGDHANAPYGHRDNDRILELTRLGVERLFEEGATLVVLACNTAAAVALRTLQQNWLEDHWPGRRILGVLVPMVEAVTGVPWSQSHPHTDAHAARRIALFATRKTVESGAYRDEVAKRAPHVTLVEKACPGLVDAIEGAAGERPIAGLVSGYVQEMLEDGPEPDAAVLGCTHFPLAESAFRSALPKGVELYSQPDLVASSLKDYLVRHPNLVAQGTGKLTLLTTATRLPHGYAARSR